MPGPTGCPGSEPSSGIETLPWISWCRTVDTAGIKDYSPAATNCDWEWCSVLDRKSSPHWPRLHGSQSTCLQNTQRCSCGSGRSHFYKTDNKTKTSQSKREPNAMHTYASEDAACFQKAETIEVTMRVLGKVRMCKNEARLRLQSFLCSRYLFSVKPTHFGNQKWLDVGSGS